MIESTADLIEVVWSLITTIGFVISLFTLQAAWHQRALLERNKFSGPRRIVVYSILRREALNTLVLLLYAGVGIVGLFQPRPAASWYRYYLISALIFSALTRVFTPIFDMRTRHRVLTYGQKHAEPPVNER